MASEMMTTGPQFEKFPVGGIDEPDNVAESEGEGNVDDSDEEEWNYIKGQDEENSKEDENDKNQTNKPNKDVDDDTSVDAEEDIDMESQLNPEAAEFVPVSPTRVAKESRDHLLDDVISSSPMKGCEKSLDNIIIPTEEDFRRDVAHCASSLEDELNGDLNTTAKDQLNDSQFTALSQCGDESEVMSTKAEFGDSVFGLGVSMNNSTAFVAEIHNDKENVSNDFDPIYDADKDVHNFDTIQAPDHDDPLIPGTPKSTVAEASHSPNFDGNFSGEDQPFEMEKPEEQQQQQPLSVSPIPEESRPPTFAEILKRPSPRSSATNSPRTSPEPPESPPVEKKNFNPFSNENDVVAAPESIIINNMNECEKKFETIEEESKQTFEDILLPGKTDTQDFSHANTNPFSADNVDFANFEHNTHPVNNQLDLDMMCTKPTNEFMLNNELNTPDDEKPPMTFQVETEPPKTETNFDDFISHNNSDPMTQSFIVSPVLENPSHVEMSLMPEAPLDNDASSFIVEKISENFEDEKPSMGFGFTDDKLEENEFNSIVENRFEDKPLVDTISNNEQQLLEENDYAAPLSPVREEVQEQQPPASSMQIDETHFDLKLDAPIEASPQDQSPLVPEALSPAEPEHNFNVLDADEPLETKMDHFSHPIPEAVPSEDVKAMDDFLATESRDNLIEAVSDELKDEVCLMKADVSANVENVSEVAELLDTAPVVDSQVPEEKAPESALIAPESALTAPESALIAPEPALTAPESALTQAAAQQKEEALEPTFNVDFVAAEPILTPVESAKVEEQPAEQLVVAAEVHPPTTETPPPTPAVPAVVEDKKEGLIAAAAAVAGAAVAIAAAATTKAAPTKKPTTLSSAGAKKPGVASTAAKKPTDLASKAAGAKAAPSKAAAPGAKATSPTKPVAIKKTAVTSTTTAAKPSKPLAGLKSAAATAKPLSPASKPTTPTSKPSTPTSSSRPSSAPKTSPTKTTAVKATVGAAAAAKPKSAVADKKPLTNGTSRPASSTLAAKKPATTATAATKTVGTAKPATTAAKPAAKVGAAAPKPKAPVSSTTSRPAAPAAAPAKPPPIRAPAKPSDKTGKETINKQISSAKPAAAKTAAPAKPAPIKKTDAKPTANGKVPAGKPVPKSATAVKKPPTTATAADDKKKKADGAAPTQEHTVTTTNGYEEPPLPLNGLAKDDSPLENHIHQDALVIN